MPGCFHALGGLVARPFTVSRVKELLRELGQAPKKGLGQHFLIDREALAKLLTAAELGPQDTVVEVGSGLGVLTAGLVERAGRVVALELEPALSSALPRLLGFPPNLTVVQGDALAFDPRSLAAPTYKVVATLPYYAANPILRHFLEAALPPSLMAVTVQKEVAQTIAAPQGKGSLLTVAIQLYAEASIVDYLPPRSFYPAPRVASAILRLRVLPQPRVAVEREGFFRVARGGFSAPRKQLRNSLAQGLGLPPGEAEELLEAAGLDPRLRAEALTLEQWASLYYTWRGR